MAARPERRYGARPVREPVSNTDMLSWFTDEERHVCGSCGEKACVSLPGAVASFCLGCGAVTIEGVRIDRRGRVPLGPPDAH